MYDIVVCIEPLSPFSIVVLFPYALPYAATPCRSATLKLASPPPLPQSSPARLSLSLPARLVLTSDSGVQRR